MTFYTFIQQLYSLLLFLQIKILQTKRFIILDSLEAKAKDKDKAAFMFKYQS